MKSLYFYPTLFSLLFAGYFNYQSQPDLQEKSVESLTVLDNPFSTVNSSMILPCDPPCNTCGACTTPGPNLVTNGDFDQGNTGFTSDLPSNCACVAGTYCVTTVATAKCNNAQWQPITSCTGSGNYMVVDGAIGIIWRQNVDVQANKSYNFSFAFYPNVSGSIISPTLELRVNGATILSNINAMGGSWSTHCASYFSQFTGIATLEIAQTGAGGFDDYGIDDIQFSACEPVISVQAMDDQTICFGESIVLETTINSSTGNYSCIWSPAVGLNNPTSCNPTFTPVSPQTITFTVTVNEGGCIETDQVTITVLPEPAVIAFNSGPVCETGILVLDEIGGQGVNWSWVGPNNFTSNLKSPTITGVGLQNAGVYNVIVTDANGCTGTSNTTVIVNPLPEVDASSNAPICEGEDLELYEFANAGVSYTWVGPNGYSANEQNPIIENATSLNAGLYTVIVTDANGCINSQDIDVTINDSPAIDVSSNSPVCEGEDLTLFEQGGEGVSWFWEGPNSFSSSLQNPVITNVSVDVEGFYFVTVTGDNGCTSVGEIEVEVIETFDVQASSNSPVCEGDEIFLFEDVGEGEDYFWTGPNGFTSNDQNPSIFPANLNNSGIYTVFVTKNGCTVMDEVEVIVEECCCKDFDLFCENVEAGFEYIIDCNVITVNPIFLNDCQQANWSWGDGDTGPITGGNQSATHTYETSGTFTVCMFVTEIQDGEPCWDPKEYCETIEIIPEGSISGFVYEDLNGNQQLDAGEMPFDDVVVSITYSNGFVQTTLTNTAGFYSFQNLPPGTYEVSAGSNVSTTHIPFPGVINVELEICESVTNQNFFLTPYDSYGCISGAVIMDLDDDGIRDYFDLGIPDMEIEITGNGVNETIISDANGDFILDALLPGTYTVTIVTAPANATLTSGDTFEIEVEAGVCEDNVLFTFIPEVNFVGITGIVAYDPDCDGEFDPDTHTTIGNAQVVLKDDLGNIIDETLTSETGLYIFYPLVPGTYTVEILDDFYNTEPSTPITYTWPINPNEFKTGNFLFCPVGPTFECGMSAMTYYPRKAKGKVLTVKDTRDRSGATPNSSWIPPMTFTNPQWTLQNMGAVFGTGIDKNNNIYVTQSDTYNETSSAQVGGKIYRIDALTHAVTTIATLPNSGAGLGNICYAEQYDRLYVTNFEDGKIYWIDLPGGAVSSVPYDFNNPYNVGGLSNPPYENIGERIWAIDYHETDNKLYFSVWNAQCGSCKGNFGASVGFNEIHSIQLNSNGDFPSSTNTENLEIELPLLTGKMFSNPVSDIAFSSDFSKMILAERSVDEFFPPAELYLYAHQSRILEFTHNGTDWSTLPTQQLYIGIQPSSNGQNAAGGVDYGYDNFTNPPNIPNCDTHVYATGDALELASIGGQDIYGMAVIPATGNTPTNLNSVIIDANGAALRFDPTQLGDVEVFKCGCPNGCVWSTNVSFQFISCNGANDGVATATPSNGTPPYTYQWNDPGNSTTSSITGLAPGNYCVTVTDADMCEIITCGDILEPAALVLNINNQTNIDCNSTVGSATVAASGGTAGYTYDWSTGFSETTSGASTETFNNGGVYFVTVTDARGCTAVETIEIIETTPLVLSLDSKTDIDCNNPTGSATVLATGGLQGIIGYQFDWSTGFTDFSFDYSTETFTSGGSYSVTVTDALGCTDELSFNINSTGVPTAFFTAGLGSPCGNTYFFTNSSTGNGLTYSWDFGDGSPLSTQMTPPGHTYSNSGTYIVTLTVTDVDGCISVHTETLSVNLAVDVEINCNANCLDVTCNVTSGTATWYNWTWGDGNTSSGTTNPTHTYASPGTYEICLQASTIDCNDKVCDTIIVDECPCDTALYQIIAHQNGSAGADCYSLDIDIGLPGVSQINAIIQVPGVTFTNIQSNPLDYTTSLNGTFDELLILPPFGQLALSTGLDLNAIQFCLSGVTPGCQIPIVFEWYEKNAIDVPTKFCEQEIVFECFEPECISIENSCIICENGVYKLYYEFTNTTGFPICQIDPTYLDPVTTFSPDPIVFNPCIDPGDSSGQQCITLDNLTPNTDLKIAFTAGSLFLPILNTCETDTLCLFIPECCDTMTINPTLCCEDPVDILFMVSNSSYVDNGEFSTIVKNIQNAMVDLDNHYCDPLYAVAHYKEILGFIGTGIPYISIEHDFTSSAVAQNIVRRYAASLPGYADLNASLGITIDALNGVPNGGIDSGGSSSFAARRPGADLLIVIMSEELPFELLPYTNSNTLKSAPHNAEFTVVHFDPNPAVDYINGAIASPGGTYTGLVGLNGGDPQPPINATNPRQYILGGYNFNSIPILDNIPPCPMDFVCCDDLMIMDTLIQPDSCCYAIDIKNKVGKSITKLEVEVLTNDWIFNTGTLMKDTDFQWAFKPKNKLLCINHSSGNIPIGISEDVLKFCLAPTDPNAPTSQQVVFRWYQTLPGSMEEVVCTDTLDTNCPPVYEDCVSVINPVLTCNPNNPYEYFMNFQVTNHSSFTATSVALQDLPPGFGFAFCGSSTATAQIILPISPLPPTQTSGTLCVKIISPIPILSIQTVCFRPSLWSFFDCCHSPSLTCVDLEPCCDPCGDKDIVVDSITANMAECCYKLDVINDCGYQFFNRIETEVITPGVCFGYHALGGPDAPNWIVPNSTKTKISWQHNSGIIPNGTIDDIIQFCLDDIDDPSEIPQEILVKWYTPVIGGDSLACVDTLTFHCEGENECLTTSDHMLECIPDSNKYRLTFTVTNNSTIPFKATDLITFVEPISSLILTPSGGFFPLNPPLCTGDSRTITTCIESTTGLFPPPETEIVLRHRLVFFDSLMSADTCCFESVLDTIPLSCSDCCDDFDEFCDKVDKKFTISIDTACKVTITAPQFDTCQWFFSPPDLGDGTPVSQVVVPANGMWMHTYAQNGTYNICATVFEQDPVTGDTCWTKQMCTEVTIDCYDECECSPWQDFTVSDPSGTWADIANNFCGDTIQFPNCAYEFCLEGMFGCDPDSCVASHNWTLTKVGGGQVDPLSTFAPGNVFNWCWDVSPGAQPPNASGPGLYELILNGTCGDDGCATCVLHFEIPCDTMSGGFCDTLTTVSHPYLGYSVATCFSGLDQFGGQYVLARMDTRNHQSAPINANWDTGSPLVRYHGPTNNWNATNLGEVFGIALDLKGNIYVASSAIYNYIPVGWGIANKPSIYKIDAITGNISVFNTTTLPNQKDVNLGSTLGGHEPGFGNICYNPIHDVFYVSNLEDGAIYVLEGTTGNTIGTLFDPVPGDTRNGLEPVGDRTFGVGFNHRDQKLYYSVWNIDGYHKPTSGERNEIWMVDVKSDGTIDGGTESLVTQLPLLNTFGRNFSNPVADIAFSADGNKMLLGERTMDQSHPDFFFAHDSRVLEYIWDGSAWVPENTSKYQIDTNGDFSAGGVDYGYEDPMLQVCDTVVFASGDDIHQQGIHGDEIYGIQIIPSTGGDVSVSKIIDLNNNTVDRDKTGIGDVEVFKDPCCGIDAQTVCQLDVNIGYVDSVCPNTDVQLATFITNANGAFSCSWFPTTNLSSANDCNPIFNASTPGVYDFTVTVIDAQGCINTETISIRVRPCNVCCIDQQDFIDRVNDGFTEQTSCFSIDVSPNDLTECHSVTWNFGDGSPVAGPIAGDDPNPVAHTYTNGGVYEVCMTVEEIDDTGTQCFDPEQFCKNVNISCLCSPYQADCIVLNDNLVYNGNFELGNTGFASQLAPINECADRSYAIAKNAQDKCPSFDELYAPECEGNFMIAEGHEGIVTIHSVPVTEGVEYEFAFDFYPGINGSGSPIFAVYIEGEAILPEVIGMSGQWNTACGTWTSTKTGLASLSIHQVGSNGNAIYGLDNTIFQEDDPNDVIDIEPVQSMLIYPNPTTDQITVQFENHELIEGDYIQVFDMNGREVTARKIQNTNSTVNINLGDIPNGIYFLRATTKGQIFIGKVIKQQ